MHLGPAGHAVDGHCLAFGQRIIALIGRRTGGLPLAA